MEENHDTTSPCRGKSIGRSLSLVTDLAPPSQQPYPPQHSQNPQNLNSAYPISAPPLVHHNQINPLSALPLTQHHPFAIPQPQPYQTQIFNPEHHYLLLSLSRENFKALSLRQKIAAAETSLASIHLSTELEGVGIGITSPLSSISTPATPHSQAPTRRKLKKKISWLKCRIKECTRQERILMERLQQIGEEEERRWRWMQIERQRRINEEMMEWQRGYWNCFIGAGGAVGQAGYGYSGGGYGYGHVDGNGGMLNASTPAFQPGGSVSVGGACPVDTRASVGGRKCSNEFWNTDAPVFSPVNFFKPSSSTSISVSTSMAPLGDSQHVQNGEVERLSRGWDECELSPLAEERRRSSLKWSVTIRGGDKEGNEIGMEEGEGSGSGEGEAGDSSTETAITTPTPQ
ncbi:hypothetical protein BGAL_0070g00160 [Botrytis galanthina]|uniref:Uncharacterized protein n=1 Tax=Botrytis galanthina TaxID=278940 RepID=A0A4S8R8S0_9HELO|nr:hypothetical protein BGAL_0070g00160 [Botrytis galanthina]